MKAQDSQLCTFLEVVNTKFIVPVYQRPYSWKKENCEILLKDLQAIHDNGYSSHFFGGIVYVARDVAGYREYLIIDGQQRITTISILLIVIRNYILDNRLNIGINTEQITNTYLINLYLNKETKLHLIEEDAKCYNKILHRKHISEYSAIIQNYDYFYNEISKLNADEILNIYSSIFKLSIVNVSLYPENGDDPQLIFESLNSTGLGLEEVDKIRNYILMNLDSFEQKDVYDNYWKPIEDLVLRNDLNKLLRYYLASKSSELPNEKKLYFHFKQYVSNKNIKIKNLLEDLLRYARWYQNIKNPNIKSQGFNIILSRLNKLDVNSSIPLVFNLFDAYECSKLSEIEFENCLILIENYLVRRTICALSTNPLNKVFVGLANEMNMYVETRNISFYEAFKFALLNKSGKSRFPNNYDFKDKFHTFELYNSKAPLRKYLLEMIENYNMKEKMAIEELVESNVLTIEHIMPQTLNDEWIEHLGEEWESTHSKYIDTFGNITLTAYNSEYSNHSFEFKKNLEKKGFIYSKLNLNNYVKSAHKWTKEEILERSEVLYNIAESIWWLPKSALDRTVNEGWFNWDDEIDFNKYTISKVSCFGKEHFIENILELYRVINVQLYENEPFLYLNTQLVEISKSTELYIKPLKINNDVYIEGNFSDNTLLDKLFKLINNLEIENKNIRLYASLKKNNMLFNLENEDTYYSLSIGKLAFELFSNLIKFNKINNTEIEKFKSKEYSKKIFNKTNYPIFADSREHLKGITGPHRYKKEPIYIKDNKLFITNDWYEGNREDLINWYKNKI